MHTSAIAEGIVIHLTNCMSVASIFISYCFVYFNTLVVDTKESIRQMKKIVYGVMKLMVMYKVSYIGSSHIWFEELEVVRTWIKKLKILQIIPVMCLKYSALRTSIQTMHTVDI